MKKSFTKQLISLILAVCFTLAFPALSFAADSNQSDGEAKSESIYNEFKKSDGELICVSKYGDTDKFPENSAEAVAAAAEKGADIVYVSVKKTSDGYVVLMAAIFSCKFVMTSPFEAMAPALNGTPFAPAGYTPVV